MPPRKQAVRLAFASGLDFRLDCRSNRLVKADECRSFKLKPPAARLAHLWFAALNLSAVRRLH
jgi:hypothetical protein